MKIVVIHNDDSVSWVESYSYTKPDMYDKTDVKGDCVNVVLTDNIKEAAEWGDNNAYNRNGEVFNTIKRGLLYYHKNIKGIYSSKDELYLRYIKINKLKTLI